MKPEKPIAMVTGGTGALGTSVVRELLERGYRTYVPWIAEHEVERVRALFSEGEPEIGSELVLTPADLTSPEEVARLFADLARAEGRLDLLANLAGGFTMAPAHETEPSAWQQMIEVNATTAFLATRAAIPMLRDAGGGAIVNVAAVPVVEAGGRGMAAYVASKAAVVGMTRSLAKELLADGIRVNAIAPEIIDTPANRSAMPEADRSSWLDPAEIARVVAFLAGPDASIVTGNVLVLRKAR